MNTLRSALRFCLLLTLVAGALAAATGIEPFIKMRWPTSVDQAPDGTLYYIFDPDGIDQLFERSAGAAESDAVQLTDFTDGIDGYDLSPDGRWLAITASLGGSEQSDLFLMSTRERRLESLFEDPQVVYGGVLWRRDSAAFAFRANDESSRDFYIYELALDGRQRRKVLAREGYHSPVDYSRDGSRLMVGKYHSASHSEVFEVDLASSEVRTITPVDEAWSFSAIGYAAGEESLLVRSNYRGDQMRVFAIDLASLELEPRLPALADHEVDIGVLDDRRELLAIGVNEDGYRQLRLFEVSTGEERPVAAMARGIVGNIEFAGDSLIYVLNNSNTPGVAYRWRLDEASAEPVQITAADTAGVDVSKFRLPELIHYPSFDGTEIPAFLYLPADHQPGTTIPFIVYYHGGPEGQFRPSFVRAFQYFLARGFGILAPNVRGSSGYGKAWLEADNYERRMTSVKDGVWAAKYLVAERLAKPGGIGAWGGSYGGFMVMATITEAPELYGAACNVVGIVNFETFLKQTKDYRRHLREAEYGPLTDPEFLRSISPLYKVDRIQAPLFLAHGLNDPRVPIGEAMQVAVALKKQGKPVTELYFPDEGHGFSKEENQLLYYGELARFMERYLAPEPPAVAPLEPATGP